MRFLTYIGIPFRFLFFIGSHVLIGLLDPPALKRLDNDWQWVVTGVDKYWRNQGRQLI